MNEGNREDLAVEYLKKLIDGTELECYKLIDTFRIFIYMKRKQWNEEEINRLIKLYEVNGLAPSEIEKRLFSGEGNGMYGKKGPNLGLSKENSERINK